VCRGPCLRTVAYAGVASECERSWRLLYSRRSPTLANFSRARSEEASDSQRLQQKQQSGNGNGSGGSGGDGGGGGGNGDGGCASSPRVIDVLHAIDSRSTSRSVPVARESRNAAQHTARARECPARESSKLRSRVRQRTKRRTKRPREPSPFSLLPFPVRSASLSLPLPLSLSLSLPLPLPLFLSLSPSSRFPSAR